MVGGSAPTVAALCRLASIKETAYYCLAAAWTSVDRSMVARCSP